MFGRNQLGCQAQRCACGRIKGFARGEEVARSLRNGRIARREGICIEEIMRRAERHLRSRKEDGIPVRIINGWRGEYLVRMAKRENSGRGYTRGRLLPNARWTGSRTDCDGHMRWGDVVEGGDSEIEFQRWGRNRKKNEKPPTRQ